ncbi:hypothetical protein [Runella sp. SP2]|uniref:hypothetical protein n=1 Tax=Runella sp. SP2 TaxID=2268026 RepID=UPI000F097630|nr:hypothetical protein [Runella sp. SP2]AYQ33433.1 hypothetical protein DTQ70_15270 [Runella sp. SP2]
MKKLPLLSTIAAICFSLSSMAQMPNDAIYMSKGQVCVATMYTNSSWKEYWENTLKRENLNIGTHTTQSVMVMPAIGITNRLNVMLALPYVWTQTSAGNLMGQKGLQDLSGWLKWKAVDVKGFSLNGLIGASIPVSKYVPDFLPMSIGLQCRTVSARILPSFQHKSGAYVTGHWTYSWRSNIYVDRDAYQADDRVYNTNEVSVPNATDWGARVGILKRKWQTEVFVENFSCVNGDNIRRNDMPFPTNKMEATTVGWYGKLQPKALGMNARVSYVTNGLNMGQSTSIMVGVLYLFNFKK